jgi:hypothetical protein
MGHGEMNSFLLVAFITPERITDPELVGNI